MGCPQVSIELKDGEKEQIDEVWKGIIPAIHAIERLHYKWSQPPPPKEPKKAEISPKPKEAKQDEKPPKPKKRKNEESTPQPKKRKSDMSSAELGFS